MELHAFERMAQLMDDSKPDQYEPGMSSLPMPTTAFPAATPIGMAYVPYQQWQEPYDADMALDRGTMFPELDLPFMGGECSE